MTFIVRRDYLRWPGSYHLVNDLVSLVAVPAIGGRVMAFGLGGENLLWQNARHDGILYSREENQGDGSLAAWKNYGGAKVWPAPQGWGGPGQWPGPPDAVLDTGRYTAEVLPDGLSLTSPPDRERTGLQISRRITLTEGSSLVGMDLSFTNVSDRDIAWGLWENVQLSCESVRHPWDREAVLFVPRNPQSRFPGDYTVLYGDADNPQWQPEGFPGLMAVHYDWKVGKIGLDSDAGWLAFTRGETGSAFCLFFSYDASQSERYPDCGCSVECWTQGAGIAAGVDWGREPLYHLEAEVLGPITTLPPDSQVTLPLHWGVCRCPAPILRAHRGGCVSVPLTLAPDGDGAHMNGTFGVWHRGQATMRVELTDGDERELVLGNADPNSPLVIDQLLDIPLEDVRAAELFLHDTRGSEYLLDRWSNP